MPIKTKSKAKPVRFKTGDRVKLLQYGTVYFVDHQDTVALVQMDGEPDQRPFFTNRLTHIAKP